MPCQCGGPEPGESDAEQLSQAMRALCFVMKNISKQDKERLLASSTNLRSVWRRHLEADRERRREARDLRAGRKAMRSGLKKLTKAERDALGVRER